MRMIFANRGALRRFTSLETGIEEFVRVLAASLFGSAVGYTCLEISARLLFAADLAIITGRRLAMSETILQDTVQPCHTIVFRTSGFPA